MDIASNVNNGQTRMLAARGSESNGQASNSNAVEPLDTSGISGFERWARTPKPRGRHRKDPEGQTVQLDQCRNIDDLENHLRDYLQAPAVPAEHATVELVFPVSAAFMVYTTDLNDATKSSANDNRQIGLIDKLNRSANRTALSVMDALAPMPDTKDRMRKQKAIAKVCAEACERADGFKYSFHNNWLSKEDEAYRFSYFCNDSTLNKGRAANEGAGAAGKKMRKAVYDCDGLISIKFSSTKQNLEIHYKHVPLHKTYAERAPPPRPEKRRLMEMFNPSSIPLGWKRHGTKRTEPAIEAAPRKRRRAAGHSRDHNSPDPIDLTCNQSSLHSNTVIRSAGATSGRTISISNHNNPRLASASGSALSATTGTSFTITDDSTTSKTPSIPGTMRGALHNGKLDWRPPPSVSNRQQVRPGTTETTDPRNEEMLPGIVDAATSSTTTNDSIAISELQALRRKLEEAEERIRRLESGKGVVQAPSQHGVWPPGHPSGYPQPQPNHPYYHPPANHVHHQDPPGQPPSPPSVQQPGQQPPQPLQAAAPVPSSMANSNVSQQNPGTDPPVSKPQAQRPAPFVPVPTKWTVYTQGSSFRRPRGPKTASTTTTSRQSQVTGRT